jgi:hypothetical protein
MRKHAQDQAAAMYEGIGAKRVVRGNMPPSTHNMSTARMSREPADGVCNAWGQTHDIPNLFISDGSALTSPGAANRRSPSWRWCCGRRNSSRGKCNRGGFDMNTLKSLGLLCATGLLLGGCAG